VTFAMCHPFDIIGDITLLSPIGCQMSAQIDARVFLYDVDGEGACVFHFANTSPEGIYVSLGASVMAPDFFKTMQAMHARSGHTMTMELSNEKGTVWSVRIGRGDFGQMLDAIAMALAGIRGKNSREAYHGNQN